MQLQSSLTGLQQWLVVALRLSSVLGKWQVECFRCLGGLYGLNKDHGFSKEMLKTVGCPT